MSEMFYTKAPYNSGHGHFGNDYIQSFPDLHAPSTFEERAKYTREKLRYQLLKTKPEDAKNHINMRNCFKLQTRENVQFCLKNKVPGVTFAEAATLLGYRKI